MFTALPPSSSPLPRVNDVVLAYPQEALDAETLRQRACSELLRQAAQRAGLLADDDPVPLGGAMTEAASSAIEALLARELPDLEPDEPACRRWHAAHAARFAVGERVLARHVLFAVTPGVDVQALRQRAEACLLDLRSALSSQVSADDRLASGDERFAAAAAQWSNCPSGAHGGHLGWLRQEDCAPEFARELFGRLEVGVLARLVHSRFGLHVVAVLAREPGRVPPYESVKSAVAQTLRQQRFATALRQYLQRLAGQALLQGVDLEAATTPLLR